jgi:hypothetical protein
MKILLQVDDDLVEPESKITTFALANILEKKYTLYSKFAEMNQQFMADKLTVGMQNALEGLMKGHPIQDPFATAESFIADRFKEFVGSQELDGIVAGVPTKASLMGYSRRKVKAKKKGLPRPSFIDTGALVERLTVKVQYDE